MVQPPSPAIRELFPAAVVASECLEAVDVAELLPAEAEGLGRAVAKRASEYAAGRRCARQALAALGIVDFAVRRAADRAPIWPPGITGSITHTDGYCAAVAARQGRIIGLGLDTETVGGVGPQLWPAIGLPAECDWLYRLPQAERAAAAALLFSAKESFYKCQYPVLARQLDFHDVRVSVPSWGGDSGEFTILPASSLPRSHFTPSCFTGRYLRHGRWLSTGVTMFGR